MGKEEAKMRRALGVGIELMNAMVADNPSGLYLTTSATTKSPIDYNRGLVSVAGSAGGFGDVIDASSVVQYLRRPSK